MGKKHKHPKDKPYAVDAAAALSQDNYGSRWNYFKTLRKAVRFARDEGLTAADIMDQDGNIIPELDLMDPIYDTAPELLVKLKRARETAEIRAESITRVNRDWDAETIALIRGGIIPVKRLRHMTGGMDLESDGRSGHINGQIHIAFINSDPIAQAIIEALKG